MKQLEVGYETGEDRLCLWLPMIGRHVIDAKSPLASWTTSTGFTADADSHIVIMVRPWPSQCRPTAGSMAAMSWPGVTSPGCACFPAQNWSLSGCKDLPLLTG